MTSEARPERYSPSVEWDKEERIKVALDLINEMGDAARAGKWASPLVLGDFSDRLNFILTMSPKFLEDNRDGILNGHPHPDFRFPSS